MDNPDDQARKDAFKAGLASREKNRATTKSQWMTGDRMLELFLATGENTTADRLFWADWVCRYTDQVMEKDKDKNKDENKDKDEDKKKDEDKEKDKVEEKDKDKKT